MDGWVLMSFWLFVLFGSFSVHDTIFDPTEEGIKEQ